MRLRGLLYALAAAVLAVAGPALAQDMGQVQSPVLTVESERLFTDSAFGRQIARGIEREGAALAAENRRIEAELNAEERALTRQRETLPPAEFRALADAFDEKVRRIRREQDAKARDIARTSEEAQRSLLDAARPVLEELMRQSGAVVIVERRSVFLSSGLIDITDEAIARLDATLPQSPPDEPAAGAAQVPGQGPAEGTAGDVAGAPGAADGADGDGGDGGAR